MALFRPGFDLEAGGQAGETWNGRLQSGTPTTLRHRAQASQRFIVGEKGIDSQRLL